MQLNKVEAIYALREAAEQKATAEIRLDRQPSPVNRDALLNAQMNLESLTQTAIEVCHECGHEHAAGAPHAGEVADTIIGDNIINVDFRPEGEQGA